MIVIHDVNTFDCTVSVAGPPINLVRKKAIQLLRHLFVVKKEQPSFSAVVLFSENYILAYRSASDICRITATIVVPL